MLSSLALTHIADGKDEMREAEREQLRRGMVAKTGIGASDEGGFVAERDLRSVWGGGGRVVGLDRGGGGEELAVEDVGVGILDG